METTQISSLPVQKKTFTFDDYAQGLLRSFQEHEKEIAISCLMKNHSIWKISFGMLVRYIRDFQEIKQFLALRDGDRVLVLSGFTVDAFITFLIVTANHLTAVMADAAIPDEELMPLIDYCQISAVFTEFTEKSCYFRNGDPPYIIRRINKANPLNCKINKEQQCENQLRPVF